MRRFIFITSAALVLIGCKREALTGSEARVAVEEIASTSQAETLTGNTIEISTNFTIGGALQQAASELRDFYESQLPCAAVELDRATLSIEYGASGSDCSYRGQTFTGTQRVELSKNDQDEVVVEHHWDALSNGRIEVTGEATATWNFDDRTRHIVHQLQWTNVETGKTGQGSGDRLQHALDGDIAVGIEVEGSRSWQGQRGQWDLAIEGVQMRWRDPVPQAGRYTLSTPFDKDASVSFTRKNSSTITVTVASGKRSFDFDVTSLGAIEGG